MRSEASPYRSRLWILLSVVAATALILVALFLPYEASTEREAFEGVTVDCGNTFQGIGGGPEFLEITEGAERLEGASAVQVTFEMNDAADACSFGATIRLAIAGVLLVLGMVLILVSRRRARRRALPPA